MQRSLLGLTVLMAIGLMVFLVSRRLVLETRRRDSVFLDMIANVSGNLNRLDSGFDDIAAQTGIARDRLRQLIALHRENLFICAILSEKRQRLMSTKKLARRRRRRSAVT